MENIIAFTLAPFKFVHTAHTRAKHSSCVFTGVGPTMRRLLYLLEYEATKNKFTNLNVVKGLY